MICPGPKCFNYLQGSQALCASCWARVPVDLKDRVAYSWSPGGPDKAHKLAIRDAVASLERPATN